MTRHSLYDTLRRFAMANFTCDNRVVPDHHPAAQTDLGGVHSLRLQCMAAEETVKFGLTTRENIHLMVPLQFLDAQRPCHG